MSLQERAEIQDRDQRIILVVEDDAAVRRLVCEMLRRQGYTVVEASTGPEAVEISKTHKPGIHVVLTDILMPGMDGVQLTKQLLRFQADLRVIYMSAYSEEALRSREGITVSGIPFLQKPFSQEVLLDQIQKVTETPRVSD